MIRAAGHTGRGTPVLLLGLSGENITRLTAGEPIRITAPQLAELGLPPMEIAIHYGRTEQAVIDDLQAHGLVLPGAGPGDAG